MKIIGVAFIVFGLVDLIGSYSDLDVWTDWFGVELPELIWKFSAYIEIAIGYLFFRMGSKGSQQTDK